jgi:ATP-binding cassette, subfamily B, bacterial CvaB/MchF/RaxB
MLVFSSSKRLPIVRQAEAAECGLACLAMVASFHGYRTDLNALRRRYPASQNGVTLRALIRVASHLQLAARPLRIEMHHLAELRLPAILHWDMTHFVVLKSVAGKGIVIHDPARGERLISLAEASKHFTGVALELSPTEGFVRQDERRTLPFSVFWSELKGSNHALIQVLVLMQITVDEVIARGDVDLLFVLALGFGLLMLVRAATTAIRSLVLLILQNVLHFQLGSRLFHHLIRLPTSFFEKRHIGDILSRFTSLQPIRNLLAEGMIAALIDGVMALLTLAMIFFYSGLLSVIVLGAIVVYAIVRLALYRTLWTRTEATIQAGAQESSNFIHSGSFQSTDGRNGFRVHGLQTALHRKIGRPDREGAGFSHPRPSSRAAFGHRANAAGEGS